MRFLILLCLPLAAVGQSQKMTYEQYIAAYAQMAVEEMERSGVPASITLAQGILESGIGGSRLAVKANNHFGIKCHDWVGPVIYHDDDKKDECFRKYKSAAHSFRDHSDFLRGRSRYAFLFQLDPTDYKGWAHGLRKAGYATNPRYGDILISLIENLELYEFDTHPQDAMADAAKGVAPKPTPAEPKDDMLASNPGLDEEWKSIGVKEFEHNGLRTVKVLPNESFEALCERVDQPIRRILKYNEIEDPEMLRVGMNVYLQPKRNKAETAEHFVQWGETVFSISQKYGIRMQAIYKKNGMEPGEEPRTGETLQLRKNSKEPVEVIEDLAPEKKDKKEDVMADAGNTAEPEPKPATPKKKPKQPESPAPPPATPETHEGSGQTLTKPVYDQNPEPETENFTDIPIATEPLVRDLSEDAEAMPPTPPPPPAKPKRQATWHVVEAGDTLYSLARKHGSSVEQIRNWNNLDSNIIRVGQRLVVSK